MDVKLLQMERHRCSNPGCDFIERLDILLKHETCCPERTIRCPHRVNPTLCGEAIKMKDFHDHALRTHNIMEGNQTMPFPLPNTGLFWEHFHQTKLASNYLRENVSWTYKHQLVLNTSFYLVAEYVETLKLFVFHVLVMGGVDIAERFSAEIKIVNSDEVQIWYRGPVLAVDRCPTKVEDLLFTPGCFTVSLGSMKPHLKLYKEDSGWFMYFQAKYDVTMKTSPRAGMVESVRLSPRDGILTADSTSKE